MKLSKANDKAKGAPKKGTISFSAGKKKSNIAEVDPETFSYTPLLPGVNVVPRKVTEKYEVKGVARKTIAIVGGIAGAFILVFIGGQIFTSTLTNQVTTLETERSGLMAEVDQLRPYETYQSAVAAKRTALSTQVESDVNMGTVYGDLYNTGNSNDIFLTNISIQQQDGNGLDTGGCTNPDPFIETTNVIGCITLQGTSGNPEASKGFVEDLVAISDPARYASPFISSIGTAEGVTNFDASISFTKEVYTHQYDSLKLTIEELLALEATPTEEAPAEEAPVEEPLAPIETPDEEETETGSSVVSAQAAVLVPELSEDNLAEIDTIAQDVCNAENVDTAVIEGANEIRGIIEAVLPEDGDLDGIVSTVQASMLQECEGGE